MEALLALSAAVVLIAFAIWRATIVFEVHATAGRVFRARGRMPAELYREIIDVLERGRVTGRVRGRLDGGAVAVQVSETIGADVAQRLRNVVGRFPAARIKTGPAIRAKGNGS